MNDPVTALAARDRDGPLVAPFVGRRAVIRRVDDASAAADSFEQLFEREYGPMVQVAYLLVGSHAEAEDVVQDALAQVQMRWSRLDRPGGYLRRAVVNRATDVLRRRRLEQRFGLLRHETTEQLGADELIDALARLAPKARAAVVLRYYAGLKEREIAEALGVRPGTVKSTLHRALARLRKEIEA